MTTQTQPWAKAPLITRETSAGLYTVRIVDEMLEHREIECVGTIDAELTESLALQLRYLQRTSPTAEATMFINSPGGELASGLAVYDLMRAAAFPIRTVCMGMAASMAALLFMAGTTRDMLPHAKVMIHDPLVTGINGGSALSMKATADMLLRNRQITADIIAECTGKSMKDVLRATAHDTYFEADEAVEWGLADRVIESL